MGIIFLHIPVLTFAFNQLYIMPFIHLRYFYFRDDFILLTFVNRIPFFPDYHIALSLPVSHSLSC